MNIADIRDKLKTIAERTTSSGIRTVTPNVGDPVKTTTSGNVGDPVQTGLIDTGDSEYDDAVVDPIKANRDQADKIFKQAQAQIAATKAAQRGGEQPEQNLPYKDPRKEAELQRTIAQMQGNLGDAEAWSKEVAQQEIENSAKMAARAQELADMGIDVNQQLPKQVKDQLYGFMSKLLTVGRSFECDMIITAHVLSGTNKFDKLILIEPMENQFVLSSKLCPALWKLK